MRKSLAALASVSLALLVSGCGGGGLSSLIPNTLAGGYAGTGSASSSNDVFQANISIGSDGELSGTFTDTTDHDVATVGGNVSALGVLNSGTISVANGSGTVLGTGTLTGTFSQVSGQTIPTISATLIGTVSGSATTFTFSALQSTLQQVVHRP